MLCLTYLSQPVGSRGGFCSACASLPRVRLLCPVLSWCLEVILAYSGCFGTEAGFSVLQQHSGHCCFAWSSAKLSCCSMEGSASPEWAPSPGLCEHRQALLCLQSLRDGFCSRSRPPIQVQVLLAPVKLSDNLWAGRVPCEQMGWLSWQPRVWDAQLAEGNGSWAPRCSCPNACPCWSYPGKSRPRGVWHGHGVFHSRGDTPTFCPGLLYPITEDEAVSEVLSAWAPLWGQLAPATILCPPETHLEGNSIAIISLATSAGWFPVRSESWDKGIKTSSLRLQKLSQALSPGKALMLITLRGSSPHTGMHCMMIDTLLINCY